MAESRAERHGADLLGHLPVDRFARGATSSLTEASYALASEQLDRLSRACAVLETGRDAFLLTAFATLLARLAGQEVVTLGNIAAERAVLTFSFDDGASFRSLLSTRLSMYASANEPCAVGFVSATPPDSSADLPLADLDEQCLRMAVSLSDAAARFIWPVPPACGMSPSCISGCITSITWWQVPRPPLIVPGRHCPCLTRPMPGSITGLSTRR